MDGPHLIKLRTNSEHLVSSVLQVSNPQGDIRIDGGYATCTTSTPSAEEVATIRRDPGAANTSLLGFTNATNNPRRRITLTQLVLRDGVGTGAGTGGAVTVLGAVSLILGRGVDIRDNRASSGGGIHALSLAADPEKYAEVFLVEGPRIRNNDAVGATATAGRCGGIYATGMARVTLGHGQITNNRARNGGGGVAVSGPAARLQLQPGGGPGSHPVSLELNQAGARAFDGNAEFEDNRGFGGAIHLTGGATLTSNGSTTVAGTPAVLIALNTANFGGAIQATGSTTDFSSVVLNNIHVYGNYAYGKGGAFHVLNGVDFTVRSLGGPCASALPGDGRAPCSRVIWNQAANDTYADVSSGGGAVFVDTEAGASRAIFRSGGVLYALNEDINGTAAVAAAISHGSTLSFVRSIFVDNVAGSTSATLGAMIESFSAPDGITFRFNTVLAQDVRHLFFTSSPAQTVQAHGSILWQGTTIPIMGGAGSGKVVPGAPGQFCLNLHNAHLSALSTTGPGVTVVEPRIDHEYTVRPRGSIDSCATSTGDSHYLPDIDAWGQATNIDVPSITDWLGPVDMGAIERSDLIMHAGFGTYPAN